MELASTRVLVTGSRHWDNPCRVHHEVRRCLEDLGSDVVFVHGDCPRGVDFIVRCFCERYEIAQERHPAEWDRYGLSAGTRRNGEMVALGARLCLAFPTLTSRGTWDCIRRAVAAGIETRIYPWRIYPG